MQVRWFRPLRRSRDPADLNHRTHRKVHDRRRGGRLHRWRRHRRRVAGRRPRRARVARHPLPRRRARPSTACAPPSSTTGPRPTRCSSTRTSTASPTSPSRARAVVQCVRGASETGWSDVATLFRTLLQLADDRVRITTAYFVPDDDLIDRLCDAADRGVHVEILLPGPHADKRFVQLAGEAAYDRLLDHGIEHLELPAVDAPRQGHDRRRHRRQRRLGQPQRPLGRPRRGDQPRRPRRGPRRRRSTATSTTTSSAASGSSPVAGTIGAPLNVWPRRWSARSAGSSDPALAEQHRSCGHVPADRRRKTGTPHRAGPSAVDRAVLQLGLVHPRATLDVLLPGLVVELVAGASARPAM